MVRQFRHGKTGGKVVLSVDVNAGKLTAVRSNKDAIEEKNVFPFDKSELIW